MLLDKVALHINCSKCVQTGSVTKLLEVADNLLQGKETPENSRKNNLIPHFKAKSDVRSLFNYRRFKLL